MNVEKIHRSIGSCLMHSAIVLALVSSAQTASAESSLSDLYATGVDDAGVPVALGAADTHWEVSVTRGPWVQAISEKNNYCSSCGKIWLDWPLGDANTSSGITHPDHVRDDSAPNLFSWRQSFTVPADADPASVTISYRVGFDDRSRNAADDGDVTGCDHTVWLNGTAYPMTSAGNNTRTECVGTIPAGSNFTAGSNTLEFRITNVTGYYGFRVEDVTSTYDVATVCGDALVQGDEACDDGNDVDGDGCSAACEVEDGYACETSEFVFNGDFEFGDTSFAAAVPLDPNPVPTTCAGSTALVPNDNFYYVTSAPYFTCECDGGQGLCLAVNGGGGTVWAQSLTGLTPDTDYVLSFAHALKDEVDPAYDPSIVVTVDGVTLATVTPDASPDFQSTSLIFTTGPNQTTATLEFANPNGALLGNDAILDSISLTGPSVCASPCGDGVLGADEQCDDGNDLGGDGCSETCEVELGWGCDDSSPSACTFLCGNGSYDDGESCDDGNDVDGDGCSASCEIERLHLALYSTGVDDSEIPLADGATDTHWEVNVDGGAWAQAINDKNNYCSSCGGVWLEWPIGDQANSRGITHPDHVRTTAPGKLFSWRQSFTVPADADPATVTISYRVGFDDRSRNATDDADVTSCNHTVWLNGTAYPMTSAGDNFRTQCEATLPAGSAFVAGTNTLEFRITNLVTYYGFRLDEIEGSYLSLCGNGVLDAGEACDDGGVFGGDGCSETCGVESGWSCDDVTPTTCALLCGDGNLDAGEECDDGNGDSGDGCSSLCLDERSWMTLYTTGVDDLGVPLANAAVDTHWETRVDTGSWVPAINDKNNYCASCNNTWIEWPNGNASTSRGITHPSFVRTKAAGKTFAWRQDFDLPADVRADTATLTYRVGYDDKSRNAADDGNLAGTCDHTVWLNGTAYSMTSTGNKFASECVGTIPAGSNFNAGSNTLEFRIHNQAQYYGFRMEHVEGTFLVVCGDGELDPGEACDDGNDVDGDGCSATCDIETGFICSGEPSACVSDSAAPVCGNGVVQGDEACDDGNTADGDGCSATCTIEGGFTCAGDLSVCEKVDACDDPAGCDGGDGGDGEDSGCAVGSPASPANAPLLALLGLTVGGLLRRRRAA